MRISDLSRASGVPIPTIKYYLREGILATGQRTAANQASYDEGHLRRLRLVRVLTDVGGLRIAAVRDVLAAIEDASLPMTDMLSVAHRALEPDSPDASDELVAASAEIDAWLEALGWTVSADAPARATLAEALVALRGLGWDVGPEVFRRYALHADAVAADEIEFVAASESRDGAVEATVVGTVVFERVLAALRRLAEERHARLRLGP